jgi:hypothetical protein
MKDYKKIPRITLWVLLAMGIIASVMFYVGGNEAVGLEVAGDELAIPRFSNLFLIWNYILVFLVCAVTIAVVIWEFVKTAKVDMKRAINQLCVVLGFIALIVFCWLVGSPEKVHIIGYEGTDNVGGMARLSDACLYLTYILTICTIGTLIWGVIYTKTKK